MDYCYCSGVYVRDYCYCSGVYVRDIIVIVVVSSVYL